MFVTYSKRSPGPGAGDSEPSIVCVCVCDGVVGQVAQMTSRLAARCGCNSVQMHQSQGFFFDFIYGFAYGEEQVCLFVSLCLSVCVCVYVERQRRERRCWHNGTTQQMWLGNKWTQQPWQSDANESHSLLAPPPFFSRLIT